MTRYKGRSSHPSKETQDKAVAALGACRDAMIEIHRSSKPTGVLYAAASEVVEAIDEFAGVLMDDKAFFVKGQRPAPSLGDGR